MFRDDTVMKGPATDDYETNHPGRRLVRIGHTTASIEQEAAPIVDRVAKVVLFEVGQGTAGRIMVLGSSSGGRCARDLAVRLAREGLELEYCAPIDAAFFPNSPQLTNSPREAFGHSDTVPIFNVPGINAKRRECFFQTLGNQAKLTSRGRQFTSQMGGGEIHGTVSGFTPMKRDRQVA